MKITKPIYQVLKTYPSIQKNFEVGDLVVFHSITIEEKCNPRIEPAQVFLYKHLLNNATISREEVEENPDYFEKIDIEDRQLCLTPIHLF